MFRTQPTHSNTPYPVISLSSPQSNNDSILIDMSHDQPTHSLSQASVIQTNLIEELLRSNKIKANVHQNPATIIRDEVIGAWNQNIEMLALSQLNKPAAVLTTPPTNLMLETGIAIARSNSSASQFAFITGIVPPHRLLNAHRYDNLDGQPIDLTADTHVYIPIRCYSSNDCLSGKNLAKALNYFLGNLKCSVTMYFESDNGLPENTNKKNQWLTRNSEMLDQVGKRYGLQIRAQEFSSVLPDVALAKAEALFMDCVPTHSSLIHALKKDVKKVLTRKSIYEKHMQTNDYLQYWMDLLDTVSKDPNLTPEARSKLLYFWYNVWKPPIPDKQVYNPFSLFNNTQQRAAVLPIRNNHSEIESTRESSLKIKVSG